MIHKFESVSTHRGIVSRDIDGILRVLRRVVDDLSLEIGGPIRSAACLL